MNHRVIIQSRTTSKRLPGKSLLPICGIPITILCAKRLKKNNDLLVVTSKNKSDDALSNIIKKNKIKLFRGSLNNVLSRFYNATLDLKDDDIIIRATADNPIPDYHFIKKCLKIFKDKKYDYLYFDSPKNGLPYGLCIEIFFVKDLRRAHFNSKNSYDKEHVATWIKRNTKNKKNLSNLDFGLKKMNKFSCSINIFEDYIKLNKLFNFYKKGFANIHWKQLIEKLNHYNISSDISRIGIGTANFGMSYGIKKIKVNKRKINKILNFASKKGINFIDTARIYGDAEKIVGNYNYKIFTKLDTFNNINNYNKLSDNVLKKEVSVSINKSLKYLKRASLDVVLLHEWKQYYYKKGLIWKELLKFKNKGKIIELGVSVDNCNEAIEALNEEKIKHLHIPFNILDYRWNSLKFQKLLKRRPDVKIYARSIFLQGLLLSEKKFWPNWVNSNKILMKIKHLRRSLNLKSNLELCLRYVLSINWISHIILGVENEKQLKNILKISSKPIITDKMIYKINNTFVDIPSRLIQPYKW